MTALQAVIPPAQALPLGEREFRRIAAMLHEDSGISLPEGKTSLVHSRLCKRLRALGIASFKDYVALVSSKDGAEERQAMLSALTTNVTRFFREPHHFDDLRAQLRGGWIDHARRGGALRIWSAACSSGEEPYSIALTVLEAMPDAARYDVRILATDIDPNVVRRGAEGRYPASALQPAPDALRERWTSPLSTSEVMMGLEVQELVRFRELNLMDAWPMRGRFQAIFCRNVVIYFDGETQSRLWRRFAPLLAPGGRLYVGHSERVDDPAYRVCGQTTYRMADAA